MNEAATQSDDRDHRAALDAVRAMLLDARKSGTKETRDLLNAIGVIVNVVESICDEVRGLEPRKMSPSTKLFLIEYTARKKRPSAGL